MDVHSSVRVRLALTGLALALTGTSACGDDDNSPADGGLAGQGGNGGTTGGSTGGAGTSGTTGTSGAGGSGTGGSGTADAGADAGVQLSDAQIASIMMTANTGEVQEGQLASSRTTASSVRDFSDRMVTDHAKANDMLMITLQSLPLTPETNSISQELMAQATAEIQDLKKASGSDFDRKYMKAQVTDHMMVLDLIDSMLLPQVDSGLLRRQLMAMRATMKAHLDSAEQIQKTL